MAKKEYSAEIQQLLKTVLDECRKEDRSVRERQILTWRRLKLFWEGFQHVWYSETAHDWRVWDSQFGSDNDQAAYDKPVNVFRAYLESIIAALSITIPPIKCYPDDAENPLDLDTAHAGDKISELIYRHNDMSLFWLHSLFVYCTEGMVACYNYSHKDNKYGTYQSNEYEDVEENHQVTTCPLCQNQIDDQVVDEFKDQQENKFDPGQEDIPIEDMLNSGMGEICPTCMQMMIPQLQQQKFVVTRLSNSTLEPKNRICMKSYGGLFIKIPIYAKCQDECGYLIFSEEIDYTKALDDYSHIKDARLSNNITSGSPGAYEQFDMWGRLSPQYQNQYPENVVTREKAWIRPHRFNCLKDEAQIKELKKLFPEGVCITSINDNFAEAYPEALDDHWTLTYNPLSDYLHFDPLGLLLVSVQEITNDLISLILQTIEHGIPQTFADTGVLNFKAYSKTEVTPGGVFPATAKSGKSLGDGFHEVKTATLSQEVLPFNQAIQSYGQLVSGALPSLFGGQLEGSDTASEYSMSRSQALQRISNTWKIFITWIKNINTKIIPMYIKETQYDEREVQKTDDGNFVNVLIRRAELEGKIGRIELEANENLPLTWSQVKDVVMNLMNGNNPQLIGMMTAPENLPLLYDAIGLTDFYVPGEDDREKQYDEIKMLLNSQPMPVPPQPGMPMDPSQPPQPQEMPSVEIDPIFDNNQVEFEICRKWIVSPAGRQAKQENPDGYRNVLLHGQMHFQLMQQQQMQAQMQQASQGSGASPKKPKQPSTGNAPITGDNNVPTVQ